MACLQGHLRQAMQHLRSGLKLLRETDEEEEKSGSVAKEVPAHPVSIKSLRRIFITLDTQARSIMPPWDYLLWEPAPKHGLPFPLDPSRVRDTSLYSFEDVQLYLESTLNRFFAFVQDIGSLRSSPSDWENVERTALNLKAQTEEGGIMLEEMLSRPHPGPDVNKRRLEIALRLLHSTIVLAITAFEHKKFNKAQEFGVEETEFDGNAHFEVIMDRVSTLIALDSQPDGETQKSALQPSQRPIFSLSTGVLATLWWTAQQTSSLTLRRKAISMMMEQPRREGFWDGPIAGKLALQVFELEQQGIQYRDEFGEGPEHWPEDVPEPLRLMRYPMPEVEKLLTR